MSHLDAARSNACYCYLDYLELQLMAGLQLAGDGSGSSWQPAKTGQSWLRLMAGLHSGLTVAVQIEAAVQSPAALQWPRGPGSSCSKMGEARHCNFVRIPGTARIAGESTNRVSILNAGF